MYRKIAGAILCLSGVLLYITYFICGALSGAGKLYVFYDSSIQHLTTFGVVLFIVGLLYMIWDEILDYQKNRKA